MPSPPVLVGAIQRALRPSKRLPSPVVASLTMAGVRWITTQIDAGFEERRAQILQRREASSADFP